MYGVTTPQSHSQSLWPVFVIGHRHTGISFMDLSDNKIMHRNLLV